MLITITHFMIVLASFILKNSGEVLQPVIMSILKYMLFTPIINSHIQYSNILLSYYYLFHLIVSLFFPSCHTITYIAILITGLNENYYMMPLIIFNT